MTYGRFFASRLSDAKFAGAPVAAVGPSWFSSVLFLVPRVLPSAWSPATKASHCPSLSSRVTKPSPFTQVMHDVVVQKLPVRMILDRAGLVGNDGPTHHGSFDLTYLGTLPHIVIMAPSDEIELMNMIQVRAARRQWRRS